MVRIFVVFLSLVYSCFFFKSRRMVQLWSSLGLVLHLDMVASCFSHSFALVYFGFGPSLAGFTPDLASV